MLFSFPQGHAFQGGHITVEDAEMSEGMCVVDFGDGVAMIGGSHPDRSDIHLTIPAYRTAKSTDVDGRRWRLARNRDGSWRSYRRF